MTEVLEENLQCPHCRSEDVEQYATADKAKFHEEVKARFEAVIPYLPKKVRLWLFLIAPFVMLCIEVINYFMILPTASPWHYDLLFFPWHSVIFLFLVASLSLIPFLSSFNYNNREYPIAYSNWCNSYICYRCGKSFNREQPDYTSPESLLIRKNKLVKLLVFYSFAPIAIHFLGLFMGLFQNSYLSTLGSALRAISQAGGFLFRQKSFSMEQFVEISEFSIDHMIFYITPIVGVLWLLRKRQDGASLIFAGMIGFFGNLDYIFFSVHFGFFFFDFIFRGGGYPIISVLTFALALALALSLGFSLIASKILSISDLLYKKNFHTNELKIAGTFLLFVFCYALPFWFN